MLSLSDIVNVKVGIGRGVFEAPGVTVIGGQQSFSQLIKKLFANGEQGFAYDPNDLSTMFQDAAGTTPVTAAGQPVGLILDKSKGLVLGQNIATSLNIIGTGVGGLAFKTVPATTTAKIGTRYKVSYRVSNYTGTGNVGFVGVSFGSPLSAATALSANGVVSFIAEAQATSLHLYTRDTNNADFLDISIQELKGNHAYQTTSAARPILQDTPRRIDFDAVDDKLITNLPAQLTGCTVIRSVPGVGAQILTGQTIPATYEDNKDHCGLIVINRALTPSETSAITSEFNKRAGV